MQNALRQPRIKQMSHPKVGDAAPDFSCSDHNGNTVSKSDYAGKPFVLWFYPKACTGG